MIKSGYPQRVKQGYLDTDGQGAFLDGHIHVSIASPSICFVSYNGSCPSAHVSCCHRHQLSRGELGARVETLEAGNVTSVLQGGVSWVCSSRGHGHDRELFIIVAKWDILSPLVSIQVLFDLGLLSSVTERFRK